MAMVSADVRRALEMFKNDWRSRNCRTSSRCQAHPPPGERHHHVYMSLTPMCLTSTVGVLTLLPRRLTLHELLYMIHA